MVPQKGPSTWIGPSPFPTLPVPMYGCSATVCSSSLSVGGNQLAQDAWSPGSWMHRQASRPNSLLQWLTAPSISLEMQAVRPILEFYQDSVAQLGAPLAASG